MESLLYNREGGGGGEGTRFQEQRTSEERISWKVVPGERRGRPELNQGREKKGQSKETFGSQDTQRHPAREQ